MHRAQQTHRRTIRRMRCSCRHCCRSRRRLSRGLRLLPAGEAPSRRRRRRGDARRRRGDRGGARRQSAWRHTLLHGRRVARAEGARSPAVLDMVREVKALGLETCATLGMLREGQAERLKDAGLDYYNHNLDTAPEFYGKVITTPITRTVSNPRTRARRRHQRLLRRHRRHGRIAPPARHCRVSSRISILIGIGADQPVGAVEGTPLHQQLHGRARSTRSSSCAPSPWRGSRCPRRWCGCPPAARDGRGRSGAVLSRGRQLVFYGDKLSPPATPTSTRTRLVSARARDRHLDFRKDAARNEADRRSRRGLADREAAGLLRVRRTVGSPPGARITVDGRRLVKFASDDYLGLANHPDVVAAARAGAARWGGAPARRTRSAATTRRTRHSNRRLRRGQAPGRCTGADVLGSGDLANLAILRPPGRGDAIFAAG